MNCPNCGMELNGDEQTCPLCGYVFEEASEVVTEEIENTSVTENTDFTEESQSVEVIADRPKKNKGLIAVIAIVVAVIVIIGAIAAMYFLGVFSDKSDTKKAAQHMVVTLASETIASSETTITEVTVAETTTEIVTEQPTETTTSPETGIDYACAYGHLIDSEGSSNLGSSYREYGLFDIDGNDVKELIILTGNSEADKTYTYWTIDGKDVKQCVKENYNAFGFLYVKDGKLYADTAKMGFQSIDEIKLNDGCVSSENYFTSEGMMEEYINAGEALEMCDLADPSLLENNSTAEFELGYYSLYLDGGNY